MPSNKGQVTRDKNGTTFGVAASIETRFGNGTRRVRDFRLHRVAKGRGYNEVFRRKERCVGQTTAFFSQPELPREKARAALLRRTCCGSGWLHCVALFFRTRI